MKVPGGTQHGSEFRIRGKGIKHVQNGRKGDLRVYADVQVPKKLSGSQRKLLEELARSFDPNFGHQGTDQQQGSDSAEELVQEQQHTNEDTWDDDEAGEHAARDKGIFDRIKDVLS